MTPADLSALAPPRGDAAKGGKGSSGSGAATGDLGALFGSALDALAGRGEGDDRNPRGPKLPSALATPDDGARDPGTRAAARLESLAFGFERSLPIRPGALALAGAAVDPDAPPADKGETDGQPTPEGGDGGASADSALTALADALSGKAQANAAKTKPVPVRADAGPRAPATPGPAAGDADPASDMPDLPTSRAAALFGDTPDNLSIATKAEPSPGMALKATVVSQATHLPPALGDRNFAAVVDAAATLLSEGDPKGRASLAFSPDLTAAEAHARPGAAPVKVLTVQLQPHSLGTVTIALRLTADGVAMEITAADSKAAAMLRADEQRIVDAVRRSGLVGEVVSITTADQPRGTQQAQGPQAGGDAQASGQNGAGADAGRDGARRNDERGGDPRGTGFSLDGRMDDDRTVQDGGLRRAPSDGGLYL